MRYMFLVFETDADMGAMREPEAGEDPFEAWRTYHKALVDARLWISGNALQFTSTARTVRVRDGERLVQDGPFANTKEQLGGYFLLELPSLREALHWAARCPAASYATLEIRPVMAPPPAHG